MRWMTICLVVSLGLSAAAMAQQTGKTKMYKWTDENGTVHYSAKPDEQVQAEELEIRKGPEAPPANPVVTETDPLEAARCAKIRESVRNLESGSDSLEIQADDGSTRPMTAEERGPLLERYRAAQAECDKSAAAPPAQ
jgi:hypothetical protein